MTKEFNNKPIEICVTSGFNDKYGGIESVMYAEVALTVLEKYPVDMLVFEMPDEDHFHVRLAGYDFNTDVLDEETIAFKSKSLHIDTFWFKIDDYGDKYVGTFLFPEEY